MPNKHSRMLAPSSMDLRFVCVGSGEAEVHHPDLYSEPAEEGTGAHEHAEACFRLKLPATAFIGREFNGYEVTATQCDHVQPYVDIVNSRTDVAEYRFIELQGALPHIHSDLFGTPDASSYDPKLEKLYIDDFKYGFDDVPVHNNKQLWTYGLIVVLFMMQRFGIKPKLIEFTIHQPRNYHGDTIKSQCVTYNDLMAFERALAEVCERVTGHNPERVASPRCKNCKGKINCPEYKVWSGGVIEAPFPLTDDSIAHIMAVAPTVKKLAEEAVAYGTERRQRGHNIPGTKLVRKKKHRAFSNKNDAARALIDAGANVSKVYKSEVRTPAQLEKEFKGDSDLEKVLKQRIINPVGDVTLALLDDNRPAIATTQEKFNNV